MGNTGGTELGISPELQPVGSVDQAVQDGVGDGRIEKPGVPVFDRDLSGHQVGGRHGSHYASNEAR